MSVRCLAKAAIRWSLTDLVWFRQREPAAYGTETGDNMEKIIMAHGAGGKTGSELMSRIFGKYFNNDVLEKMEDAAVVEVSG